MTEQSPDPRYVLGLLAGDGIGPEIVPVAAAVAGAAMAAVGRPLAWVPLPMGRAAIETHGSPLPESTLEQLAETDGWLMGPHDSASYPAPHGAALNPSGTVRKRFALYANVRPARTYPGLPAVARDADLVIVRENSQGLYGDRNMHAGSGECMPTPDVALVTGVVSRDATARIAHAACELAMRRRRHLTIVHKANVLRLTTGLFRDVCREVAAGYPGLAVDDQHVDAMTVHLVRHASSFDVVVTENMMGDILSGLAAELCGSLGIAPSLNAGAATAMAQAAHGSAPDIAGRGIANPAAMILSAAMLLDWLGRREGDAATVLAGRRVEAAVAAAIGDGVRTPDLGGTASTAGFGEAVIARLAAGDGPPALTA